MGSREINTYGIQSEDLAAGLNSCKCVANFDEAVSEVLKTVKAGDIVITMGGGDVYKIAKKIQNLKEKHTI